MEPLTEAYDSRGSVLNSDMRLPASAVSLPVPPRSHLAGGEKESAGGSGRSTPRSEAITDIVFSQPLIEMNGSHHLRIIYPNNQL